jgi:hypothetical protein
MSLTVLARLIVLICAALAGLDAPAPLSPDTLDAAANRMRLAHGRNGIYVRGGVDVFYMQTPAGALGGSDCTYRVALSTRLKDGVLTPSALATLAHELAHIGQGARCGVADAELAAEAAGFEALAAAHENYALFFSMRRRLGIMYLHDSGDTAFLVEAGYRPDEIQEMQSSLRLMGEGRYQEYYGKSLPVIFRAAQYGRPLTFRAFGGDALYLDDLGAVLAEYGVIKQHKSKAERMWEAR